VSARAREEVVVRLMDRWSFLNCINERPEDIRPLLKALLVKAFAAEAAAARPVPLAPPPPPPPEPAMGAPSLRILPASERLKTAMLEEGIEVGRLPFRVGRLPVKGEILPTEENDLAFADEKPFNLSRRHFIIEQTRRGLILRDCGSHLGTLVNGVRIGAAPAEGNFALLQPGANEVIAGAETSPFRFTLEVGPADG
jgi:CRP/FNR family cyclic AMP-dependent transcriptional regulator